MNIGSYNRLHILRLTPLGAVLAEPTAHEDAPGIFMPTKYLPEGSQPGDQIDAFVYTDSEDRPVATTERPFAQVGEFAFLQVAQVNQIGAFLDWGLPAKQLLVPYSEQKGRMMQGGIYLVYVYLDHTTHRVVASQKIEKYLGNVIPHYKRGDQVTALVWQHTPTGYRCIVDNLHHGILYHSDLHTPVEVEQRLKAYVKQVRPDGRIDLTLQPTDAADRTESLADDIIRALRKADGFLPLSDKSSPEEIERRFACSKRDFKKALGHLYKERLISINPDGITLI